MFSTSKILFQVNTYPVNWTVNRSIDDFIWLRTVLSISYPASFVPPSPPNYLKAHIKTSTTDKMIEKQHFFLQTFISKILKNQLLKRSAYLQGFLKDNDIQSLKKQSTKLKKPVKLEENWTLEGYIICDPFLEDKECESIQEYLHYTEAMKKKIKRQTDSLIEAYKEVSQLVYDLSKSFAILESLQDYYPEVIHI